MVQKCLGANRHIIARIMGDGAVRQTAEGKGNLCTGGYAYRHRSALGVKPRHRETQGVKFLPYCGCVK